MSKPLIDGPLVIDDVVLYSVAQLASKLNVCPSTIYRYVNEGRLPTQLILGRQVVSHENWIEFLHGRNGKDSSAVAQSKRA